jgi:hypothetical protein
MDFAKNKFNKFVAGLMFMAVICVGIVWYTNPELITSWLKKEPLDGEIIWQPGQSPTVIVKNKTDIEWKEVKVILNKKSVTQRYEYSMPSLVKHSKGYFIPLTKFKKSNGEEYDVNGGTPVTITLEAVLPENKLGSMEIQLGDRKL